MKVLIISNSISGGGAEKSMRLINQELNLCGTNSALVCLNNSGADIGSDSEIILERAWKSGLIGTLINFLNFRKVLKKLNPTTVIANCELPELYAALAPLRGTNLICVEHTSLPWAGRRLQGALIRLILQAKHASWVTVNRNQVGIWPTGHGARFIANPVLEPVLDESANRNDFVFIGRLRIEKGIKGILEAISKTSARIDVFGTGYLEEELKSRFSDSANFYGFVNNPWGSINRNQTLIVASEYEGDGIVIVEAIISRMPLLLLDNADLRKFQLPDKNYFKNFVELEQKLVLASQNPEDFRVSTQMSDTYKQERNLKKIISQWESYLT